jgi:hypothetical protein
VNFLQIANFTKCKLQKNPVKKEMVRVSRSKKYTRKNGTLFAVLSVLLNFK